LIENLLKTGKYQFRCLGAAIKHGNYDLTNVPAPNKEWDDGDWLIRPIDGFGNKDMIRHLLATEKPDALLLFTDPRFFGHIFDMEDEIHQVCPIAWWHVWDNDPWQNFLGPIYESVDLINCHSHMTYEMVKEHYPEKTNFIPHAIPENMFRPIDDEQVKKAKIAILGEDRSDHFVGLWVNRNARRKMPGDLLVSWKLFLDELEQKEGHRKATLVMHTDPNDQEGPNLIKIVEMLELQNNVKFSSNRLEFEQMNTLHNISDFYINISCFPAGQKVMINNDIKNIEDVKVGEMALTHKGRWMPVKQTFIKEIVNESLYEIHSTNNDSVKTTKEHPIYAIKKDKVNFLINENLEKFRNLAEWIKASELKVGDYVVWQNEDIQNNQDNIIIDTYELVKDLISEDKKSFMFSADDKSIYRNWNNQKANCCRRVGKRYIEIDEHFSYILGNWVADGETNSTNISFNKKDTQLANILLEKYNKVLEGGRIREREKHIRVKSSGSGEVIYSKLFNYLCRQYSSGKFIPDIIMNASENIKRAFLEGYVAGDGCKINNGTCYFTRCRTISNKLMINLKVVLVSLGYCPKITLEDNSHGYGEGTIWCIEWRERKRKNNGSCRSWNVNNSIISRIYKIEKTEPQTCNVYNFEVEEDHTYTLNEFTCHNCNEGFGLGTLEAMMCAKPIIALKTGGMTYQVVNPDGSENGIALEPDVRNLVGSQTVPFIYEDHIKNEKVASAILKMHEFGSEKRKDIGQKALLQARTRFALKDTVSKWDETLTECIKNWKQNDKKWSIEEIKNRGAK